ncbi:Nif3-like dinuclear metal center hexameric protein [Actinomycetospora endophytica]|uniref:GTP cyclohydrolase 1 type 2 homolog n=1 Tax=Actinomycetospora endophytica TaxID=2291215 RepID=A0ABS8PEI7_9PSEU|nr:Nif3-like dinuclear metal center hexameric protein [Actinomycetospora endophytica]MCD2196564.1 Nif3-like dinuclear metal center hexameric protein [Actinomycetospora endophytica]
MGATVATAVAALEAAYPPGLAQEWDAVGLVCGDPDEQITRVLVAVDPTPAVVEQAVSEDVDLLVTHHPLLLRGVHGVPADEPKGAVVHRLIRAGCALFAAHTNADAASPGVSDALADALGVVVERPLAPQGDDGEGIGRIGHLATPEPFAEFVERVSAALPATAWGVRGAGDPERPISRVAVSGGAGDSMLDLVRDAGVDAYVTADLRHHPADEHLQRPGAPALVDVAHWASEHPWCAQAAAVLRDALPQATVTVSTRRTDPWTLGVAGNGARATVTPTAAAPPPTMYDVIEGAARQ